MQLWHLSLRCDLWGENYNYGVSQLIITKWVIGPPQKDELNYIKPYGINYSLPRAVLITDDLFGRNVRNFPALIELYERVGARFSFSSILSIYSNKKYST